MLIRAHSFPKFSSSLAADGKLTSTPDDPRDPVVSPKGDRVFFASGSSGPLTRELHSVGIDGEGQRQLTDRKVNLSWQPAFSPDGEQVVYVVEKEGKSDLHLMADDGTGNHNITNTNKGYWDPAWSPDGKTIVTTSRDTSLKSLELVTMSPDGSSKKQLTNLGLMPNSPHYSPDGEHIVFNLSLKHGGSVLCSVDTEGEDFKTYAPGLTIIGAPDVSPEGDILFSGMGRDGRFGLYEVPLHQSEQAPTLLIDEDYVLAPTYSPDGSEVAFMDSDADGNMQIYMANSDGTELRAVTTNDDFNTSPKFSPDAKALVYVSNESGKFEVHKAEV